MMNICSETVSSASQEYSTVYFSKQFSPKNYLIKLLCRLSEMSRVNAVKPALIFQVGVKINSKVGGAL